MGVFTGPEDPRDPDRRAELRRVRRGIQPFLSTAAASFLNSRVSAQTKGDPAATLLPLVHQEPGADGKPKTTILEQPLDFTTLADKYNDYVTVSFARLMAISLL